MKIALTGASGFVGRFILRAALAEGHSVTILGRHHHPDLPGAAQFVPWSLGQPVNLRGHDALIHAAFSHVPGRYRGGEGDDPTGFLRRNGAGSQRLFEDAAAGDLRHALFLSSRAVFDGYPPGTLLTETLQPCPASLYGTVKLQTEQAVADLGGPGFQPIILRATGVYGPPQRTMPHKWSDLFAQFLSGQPVPPRIGTEVHGDDLARAVLLLLDLSAALLPCPPRCPPPQGGRQTAIDRAAPGRPLASATRPEARTARGTRHNATRRDTDGAAGVPQGAAILAHASDIMLDRHDLLAAVAQIVSVTGSHSLPTRLDPASVSRLDCGTLGQLGWKPGGMALLHQSLPALLT